MYSVSDWSMCSAAIMDISAHANSLAMGLIGPFGSPMFARFNADLQPLIVHAESTNMWVSGAQTTDLFRETAEVRRIAARRANLESGVLRQSCGSVQFRANL